MPSMLSACHLWPRSPHQLRDLGGEGGRRGEGQGKGKGLQGWGWGGADEGALSFAFLAPLLGSS
jgi:hypothetical protein